MNWLLNLFQSIVFQTVISGVFVLSEIIQNFFLKPLQKYKEVIGKLGGRGGIRTHETPKGHGFPSRSIGPLWHPSNCLILSYNGIIF